MFHLKDGIYFERGPGSGVTITIDLPPVQGFPKQKVIETDASGWASVLASVCSRGEDGNTYREALAYHGDGLL